jgi:hypothetical protein
MRVNYHKSEIVPINMEQREEVETFSSIFRCPVGNFPIKYLGVPLHYHKLRRQDLQPLIDKIIKRIARWRGKLLSQAGRMILIKTCIASISIYLLSFFKFPRWVVDLINSHMSNCFQDDYEGHRKLHLANWHMICMKKEYGGFGIRQIKDLNLCLLRSWVRRYSQDEGKLWRNIVDRKYCRKGNIFCSDKTHACPFWKGVILATQAVKMGYKWVVRSGVKIKFWEDTWFGFAPLAVQFWDLYYVCNEKTKTIAEIWVEGELRLSFRRTFTDQMIQCWDDPHVVVEQVSEGGIEPDALIWGCEKTRVYSSHSMFGTSQIASMFAAETEKT